jgi:hypothetical protein
MIQGTAMCLVFFVANFRQNETFMLKKKYINRCCARLVEMCGYRIYSLPLEFALNYALNYAQ